MKTKTELEKTKNFLLFEYTLDFEYLLSFLLQQKYGISEDDENLDVIIDKICQDYDYSSFIKRYCHNEEVHPVSVLKVEFGIGDFDDFVSECSFNEDKFEEDFIDFLP
jgi:hypothetical protein